MRCRVYNLAVQRSPSLIFRWRMISSLPPDTCTSDPTPVIRAQTRRGVGVWKLEASIRRQKIFLCTGSYIKAQSHYL